MSRHADLFVIGIVVYLLKSQWNLTTGQVSLLNSITLAASAVGALIFGRVADILGRKRIYGYATRGRMVGAVFANQAAGLIVGPLIASIFLASGLSNNLTWRLLLGLGAIPGLALFYLRR